MRLAKLKFWKRRLALFPNVCSHASKMKATIGKNLSKAKEILENNGIVGLPTETVYGLAANALNQKAISNLFSLKKRPLSNPLNLQVASIDRCMPLVESFPENALLLAKKFWPGPLTLLLPKSKLVPSIVNANKKEIGLRIPDSELTLKLLQEVSFPLAVPSANIYGEISATNPQNVMHQFGEKIEYILDGGKSLKGIESTIIGFSDQQAIIYRLGAIGIEEIEETIQSKVSLASNSAKKSFSIKTPFYVLKSLKEIHALSDKKSGIIHFNSEANKHIPLSNQLWLTKETSLEDASKNLYDCISQLDRMNLTGIYMLSLPNDGIGAQLNSLLQQITKI